MKKMSYVLICGFLMLFITGCGGTSTLKCTKTSTDDGIETKETINITFESDKPKSAEMSMDMKFDDENKEYIDLTYSMLESSFKESEQDGLKINTEKTDDTIKVKMNVDFTTVKSTDELDLSIDASENMESVKKDFEEDGYECK